MKSVDPDQLTAFLRERVGDNLRSVTYYDLDAREHEVVYVRDDVEAQYDDETIEQIVKTYQWESAGKFVEEARYVHGTLKCIVRHFERAVEMNLVTDGAGIAIGLEPETFVAQNTFVERCLAEAGIE